MKKTLFLTCAVAMLLAQAAWAQISLTATPTSQNVAVGGQFTVTIHLAVTGTTPADVTGFNLWLETAAANSGLFSINSYSSLVSGWNTPSGFATGETLTTTGSADGDAENQSSLGFIDTAGGANAHTTPITDLPLETITLQASNSVQIGQTYTFSITNAVDDGVGASPRNSGINDSMGGFSNANTTGSFTITIVPEPATWSLMILGGLGTFGLNVLRRRKV